MKPITVLICEDDWAQRRLLERILKTEGYLTVSVSTAEQAIAHLSLSERSQIDLIISDYEMPGLNGLELAAWTALNEEEAAEEVEEEASSGDAGQSGSLPRNNHSRRRAARTATRKPFILLTAAQDYTRFGEAVRAGLIDSYIAKPFAVKSVLQMVATLSAKIFRHTS